MTAYPTPIPGGQARCIRGFPPLHCEGSTPGVGFGMEISWKTSMSHSGALYSGESSWRPFTLPVMFSHGFGPVVEVKVPMKRVVW